jgi:hypothetical protein
LQRLGIIQPYGYILQRSIWDSQIKDHDRAIVVTTSSSSFKDNNKKLEIDILRLSFSSTKIREC